MDIIELERKKGFTLFKAKNEKFYRQQWNKALKNKHEIDKEIGKNIVVQYKVFEEYLIAKKYGLENQPQKLEMFKEK